MSKSPGYELLIRVVSVSIGFVIALILGEVLLRVYVASISVPETMDPGLIQYHSRLGWRLSPNWQGRHKHLDYEVDYRVDPRGFRQTSFPPQAEKPLAVFVGDSFTFGLGVNNGATYVDQLNQQQNSYRFLNAAVPGYAPEQILLAGENLVQLLKPELLVYVVYLGNDLVDLGLPFPVQAQRGKPVASLLEGELVIGNIPVPKTSKPQSLQQKSLASYIVTEESNLGRLSSLKIVQLIQETGYLPTSGSLDHAAIDQSLVLFAGILDRLQSLRAETDVKLLLIPGATAIHQPESLSGQYQSLVAQEIIQLGVDRSLPVANGFELEALKAPGSYFENDGHLTELGHAVFAEYVHDALLERLE